MLAKANLTLPPEQKIGTLIVVREIETADGLAEEINATFHQGVPYRTSKEEKDRLEVHGGTLFEPAFNGSPVALARHSKARSSVEEIRSAQILVITHAAYVQALDRLTENVEDRWSTLIEWEFGQRRFICVDELISNLVEDYQLALDPLRATVGNIPSDIADLYPGQMRLLNSAVEVLRWVRSLAKGLKVEDDPDADDDGLSTPNTSDRAVWDASAQRDPEAARKWAEAARFADMTGLRRPSASTASGARRRSSSAMAISRPTGRSPKVMDMNLKSIQAICSRHAWYSRKGKFDTLNSSRLLLPEPFPVHVVALDATAGQEVTWELLGKDRVVRPPTPKDARSYANVTLHVSRVKGRIGEDADGLEGQGAAGSRDRAPQ